ncbi:hypothetical protein AB3S75_025434 [Citrus x aurantiifolia]
MVRIWKVEFRCPITYEAIPTERKVNDSYVNVTIGASLRLLIWDWTIRWRDISWLQTNDRQANLTRRVEHTANET